MADNIISLISDSDSSDIDVPSTSNQSQLTSKPCVYKKITHSLSDSDLSIVEEENVPKKKKIGTKKIKLIRFGTSILKSNQKKQPSSLLPELKQWKEKLRCIKPNECLKYLLVVIAEDTSGSVLFKSTLDILRKNGLKCQVINSDETAVTWHWEGIPSEFVKKSHRAVIWPISKCIALVQGNSLVAYFTDLKKKKPNERIYLILHGKVADLRDTIVRYLVDDALCELEANLGITHSIFYKPYHLARFILHLTKSVSLELYRAEQEKLEQEKTFYLSGRSQNCAKVDKDNNGMKRLWIQQIAAIYRLPLDCAKVICGNHPTPYCLYETYKNLSTVKEKQELLQDILVGRGSGAKRLGPKMSGKIALLFANSNGDLHLSDWK
ncbi:crossover junction endonuclease EME1 [Halyomorpha halys]|uniref:crossover junction endonuclease EME1 n=1 Tax=Halyomorpha halys TaxID=286706 RepID=UPI0006D506F1|nr:uncharacterized protein LOC106685470 [Halyomorpha halys]